MKTLFSCRCVCKLWQSLLLDPHLINLHLSRAPISLLLRTIQKNRKPKMLHLFDLQGNNTDCRESRLKLKKKSNLPNTEFGFVNSCNGLLCLSEPDSKDPIYVCNPILGEYITLPKVKKDVKLAGAGCGFSLETKEYKVVRVLHINGIYDHYEAEIYVLGTGSWRSIGKVMYTIRSGFYFNNFVNGALHWEVYDRNTPDFIRAFDFGSEKFRVVPAPSAFGRAEKECIDYMHFGVLLGCLSICDYGAGLVDIWVMNEYGIKESWTKNFVITNLIERHNLDKYEPIMILDSGEILMLFNKDSLVSYDPREEVFNYLSTYGVRSKFQAIAFIPSFISLRDVAKAEKLKVLNLNQN
jgi:F-box interacting protein